MSDIKIYFPANKTETEVKEGDTLLDAARAAGLKIDATCSGQGTCGMCKVLVNGKERLACETPAEDGMRVELLSSDEGHVILTESIKTEEWQQDTGDGSMITQGDGSFVLANTKEPSPCVVSFAIDIGTTTVVIKAIDKDTGKEIDVRAFTNPQRVYGADVISRINNAMDDAAELSGIITEAIDREIKNILRDLQPPPASEKVVIAANTTMTYLLLNHRCRSLGLVPFEPEYRIDPVYEYQKIFGADTLSCPVLIYPYISAFVGGDIVSGLVNVERHLEREGTSSYMLIDMGTNGEIAYRNGERLLTTSTAAGPALEGGNITCGMSGLPGAIYAAEYEGGKFTVRTIANKPPKGICGSGVISLVACLLDAGIVSETGAFTEDVKELMIANADEDIVFTQKDVREFQLAKGAIRAGIDILIEEMGQAPEKLYLAGGFGQNIDIDSAFRTGLIPEGMRGCIVLVGNTSLGGCVDACAEGGPEGPLPSLDITASAHEINLGAHKSFSDKFMETMMFDDKKG